MSAECDNNERVLKALHWALEERQHKPGASRRVIYDTACLRFDLTPLECESLYRLFFAQP